MNKKIIASIILWLVSFAAMANNGKTNSEATLDELYPNELIFESSHSGQVYIVINNQKWLLKNKYLTNMVFSHNHKAPRVEESLLSPFPSKSSIEEIMLVKNSAQEFFLVINKKSKYKIADLQAFKSFRFDMQKVRVMKDKKLRKMDNLGEIKPASFSMSSN